MSMLPLRLPWNRAEDRWANVLEPVLSLPPNQGILRKNIPISAGVNVINTLLGQTQQGWIIVDQDGPATIYRSQPFNNLTLTLTSSAACNISLWVY